MSDAKLEGTVFDLDEEKGAWFEMDGGGRVKIRIIPPFVLKEIQKQTVKKRVEYKRVEGRDARFPVEDINEELQSELFWDYCIVEWDKFYDAKGKLIPCTKENKTLLMQRSSKFAKFMAECLEQLNQDEAKIEEALEKN